MTQFSYPWDGQSPTAVGDAGAYSSAQWAKMWLDVFIGINSGQYDQGVNLSSGNGLNTPLLVAINSPADNRVRVFPGSAQVRGRFYISDAIEQITISANADPNPRIDLIVLREVIADQTVRLVRLQGTPAASPAVPTLTQTAAVWEIPLARVAVPSGFLTISTGITDVRQPNILLSPQMGGTGISSLLNPFTKGDILVASAADTLVQRNIPDWNWIWGNSAEADGLSVIDGRPHQIFVDSTTIAATSTVVAYTFGNAYNPAGYLADLGSNQFQVDPGTYEVSGALAFQNSNAQVAYVGWALVDSLAPTVALAISLGGRIGAVATQNGGGNVILPPKILTFTGSEALEIRAQRVTGGATVNTAGAIVAAFGTTLNGFLQFKRIR